MLESVFNNMMLDSRGPIKKIYLGDTLIYESDGFDLEGFFSADFPPVGTEKPLQVLTAPGAATYEDLYCVKV